MTCPACKGWGKDVVTECPLNVIEPETWDAIRAADYAEHGLLPIAGGFLDQTQSYLDWMREIQNETSRAKMAAEAETVKS